MKILKLILNLSKFIGVGGVWKHVINILISALIAFLLYLGFNAAWNWTTKQNKHYKSLSETNVYLNEVIGTQKDKIFRLEFTLDSLSREKTADSLHFVDINKQHQINTQVLSRKNKEQSDIIERYRETGKVCYELKTIKQGLFNNKKELIEIICP